MDFINHDYPQKFIQNSDTPCISLYQPTHRTFPEREQDVIRYKNLGCVLNLRPNFHHYL